MVRRFKAKVGRPGARTSLAGIHPSYERNVSRQVDNAVKEFERWVKHMQDESIDVLVEALTPTFEKSRDVYAPIKTGELRRSAFLESRKFRGRAQVQIGFGAGGHPPYAALVHELLGVWYEPPTRVKYLQSALEEDASEIQERIISGFKMASGA